MACCIVDWKPGTGMTTFNLAATGTLGAEVAVAVGVETGVAVAWLVAVSVTCGTGVAVGVLVRGGVAVTSFPQARIKSIMLIMALSPIPNLAMGTR
jgi:hypothetical protein